MIINNVLFRLKLNWLLLSAIFPLFWFLYYYRIDNKYKQAYQETTSITETNRLLQEIYHPIFKTTHEYYHNGANLSLDLKIAINYLKLDSIELAEGSFERGLSILPNDDYLLLEYAKYLICYKTDFIKATECLQKIYIKQQAHTETNSLLAYCAIQEKQYHLAKQYMNARYMDREQGMMRLLELQIYSGDYIDSLFELNKDQKELFDTKILEIRESVGHFFYKSCPFNMSSDERKAAIPKIGTYSNELDDELIQLLNEEQFLNYLRDISPRLVGYRFRILNYICQLNETQLTTIEAMMKEQFALQKYFQLKMKLSSTTLAEKKQYQLELEQIATYLDEQLKTILTKAQYQAYINYNPNKWLMQSRN